MSTAPAEVTPEPESTLEQPGSQPEPASGHRRPKPWRVWILAAALLVALGAVLIIALRSRTPSSNRISPRLSANTAETLRLKGTTEAVQSRAILAPVLETQQVPTLTIIRLAAAGTRVKAGDLLAEFDRQAQMRDFIDKQAEYRKLVDQVAQEQAKEAAARAKDETELKQAGNTLRKAEHEVQKTEIVSRIDAEKNQ